MTGAELIAAERQRQIKKEGYSAGHDDSHTERELVDAAVCYALHGTAAQDALLFVGWPWCSDTFNPKDRVCNLVRAGALIAPEIDRLQRAGAGAGGS
jgi:hypothetical protein